MENKIIEVKHLTKTYTISKGLFKKPDLLKANNDVSFFVKPKEIFSIVGESGCGKSTIAKVILKIEEFEEGEVLFEGHEISEFNRKELREYRKNVQIVFQDPYSSLNPRWKVGRIIGEPLLLNTNLSACEIDQRVKDIMDKVGLLPEFYDRYAHQFSGGQRQRIGVARALALHPKLIVCDEPVSALDVSIQSQVLNLLLDLQTEFGFTYIFISHDISVVEHISDRIMVMYLGRAVEIAPVEKLMESPQHPYTRALLSAVPEIKVDNHVKERILLEGELPSAINPPSGCLFRTRCRHFKEECKHVTMELNEIADEHYCACPFADQFT